MSELNPEVFGPSLPIPNLKSSKQPCLEGLVPAIVRMGKLALETGDLPVDGVAILVRPCSYTPGPVWWEKLTGFMTFGKSSNFSKPQFLDL